MTAHRLTLTFDHFTYERLDPTVLPQSTSHDTSIPTFKTNGRNVELYFGFNFCPNVIISMRFGIGPKIISELDDIMMQL